MKRYKTNKLLVSGFAFAVGATLMSKPILAEEENKDTNKNNNLSMNLAKDISDKNKAVNSKFMPSVSDLYATNYNT